MAGFPGSGHLPSPAALSSLGMGLFDRWRAPAEEAWRPPSPGSCACEQHLENMLETVIPYGGAASGGGVREAAGRDGMKVVELVERRAVGVRLAGAGETYVDLAPTGQRTGPYHWVLELGGEPRLLYDDDAPVALDDCLAAQAGVERVAWLDREHFAVGAPNLCPSGVQASLVQALTNPRVRRAG